MFLSQHIIAVRNFGTSLEGTLHAGWTLSIEAVHTSERLGSISNSVFIRQDGISQCVVPFSPTYQLSEKSESAEELDERSRSHFV